MVGLSVILENYRDLSAKTSPQVISKGSIMISPSGFSRGKNISDLALFCGFLEFCSLCNQKLLPGKDIYMYKGDKAFCSEECRYRQIFMDDEEESVSSSKRSCTREYNCSKPPSSSSPSSSRRGKGPRNRADAAFAC